MNALKVMRRTVGRKHFHYYYYVAGDVGVGVGGVSASLPTVLIVDRRVEPGIDTTTGRQRAEAEEGRESEERAADGRAWDFDNMPIAQPPRASRLYDGKGWRLILKRAPKWSLSKSPTAATGPRVLVSPPLQACRPLRNGTSRQRNGRLISLRQHGNFSKSSNQPINNKLVGRMPPHQTSRPWTQDLGRPYEPPASRGGLEALGFKTNTHHHSMVGTSTQILEVVLLLVHSTNTEYCVCAQYNKHT